MTKWLAIFAALIFVSCVVYLSIFTVTVRYRLTLEAEVNGQSYIGSGVIQVRYSKLNDPVSRNELVIDVRGEAVILDLGTRGTLFALLKSDTDNRSEPEYLLLRAFDFPGGAFPRPVMDGLSKIKRLSGKAELPLTSLPFLVRFRNLKDPTSVEKVDALNIEASYGSGAKLVRATLEIVPSGIWPLNLFGITGEPITKIIEKRLPWLNGVVSNIDGTFVTTSNRLSNILHSGNFRR